MVVRHACAYGCMWVHARTCQPSGRGDSGVIRQGGQVTGQGPHQHGLPGVRCAGEGEHGLVVRACVPMWVHARTCLCWFEGACVHVTAAPLQVPCPPSLSLGAHVLSKRPHTILPPPHMPPTVHLCPLLPFPSPGPHTYTPPGAHVLSQSLHTSLIPPHLSHTVVTTLLPACRCPCSQPAACASPTSKSWSAAWGQPTRSTNGSGR